MSKCRSCGAPVRWVKTRTGALMPIDEAPDPAGNVGIDKEGVAVILAREKLKQGWGGLLYRSHFATCPNAKQHRRRK